MNSKPSRLEILPDELILDLFSYIPSIELYYTWYGLNRRLSAIIRSVKISFDLNDNTERTIHTLNYFSSQIVRLHIRNCFDNLDLRCFSNLRSLIIDTKLTSDQLHAIHPSALPHLKRLTFSEWWIDHEPLNSIIFTQHSSENQSMTWLKVYHIPTMPSYFLRHYQPLSYVHTMIFDRVHPCNINIILSVQTLLRRLKLTVVRWMPDDGLSKILPSVRQYQHTCLVHLDVTMNTWDKLDDLYPILSHLSCLEHLHVTCDSLTTNDFKRLAIELHTRVPTMKRFTCSFRQTYVENIKTVQCLSPLFRYMRCTKVQWEGGWHYYCVTTNDT
ncbi:unnamed protein product [Adineta ricciae]|uniref:F-box domain-containing protein n=1 Tax=Adineta ricciae TaxID=249248 RepID=A0A815C8P2_ADIRI|nr:unnamed protein product [Adineta ricciae]